MKNAVDFIVHDVERGQRYRKFTPWLLAVGVAVAPVTLGLLLRDDLGGAFDPRVFLPNLFATLSLGAVALGSQRGLFSSPKFFRLARLLLIIGLILSIERLFFPVGERTQYLTLNSFLHEANRCFIKGSGVAAVIGIWVTAFAFLFSATPSRRWRALLAALSGVAAATMLGFHCDSSSLGHILLGHIGPGLIVGAVVFVLAESLFRARVKAA